MPDQGETRFAKVGDVHIAYQVVGDGPIDVLFIPSIVFADPFRVEQVKLNHRSGGAGPRPHALKRTTAPASAIRGDPMDRPGREGDGRQLTSLPPPRE
jgi:hypothetical protein